MRTLTLLFLLLTGTTYGQVIHSYVNENGVKVFTNAPYHARQQPAKASSSSRILASDSAKAFRPLIQETSSRYGIDAGLVEAIIAVESAFDPTAVSPKDCKGLMQLHPDTARRFGVQNIFDPGENVDGGIRYLQFLMDEFDQDLELVLAAYNAGENAVRRHEGIPPYRETQRYVAKVSSLYGLAGDYTTPTTRRDPNAAARRLHRISKPNGGLLFTNAPTHVGMDN